jgi:hypothetical protein
MIDIEKFLVSLRSNKDLDGKLKPIYLADTVQEEIKIIQAAVENSRQEWVGLTNQERSECWETIPELAMKKVEAKLKEKNA